MKTIKLTESQLKKVVNILMLEDSDNHDDGTYMVIQNLVQIKNDIDNILSFKDNPNFKKLVTGEHVWSADHISTSKDDIEEVSNFITGYLKKNLNEDIIDESENEPTNPKLWSASLSWAKKRYKVCPSAYCNGAAAKHYKSKGGGWRKK